MDKEYKVTRDMLIGAFQEWFDTTEEDTEDAESIEHADYLLYLLFKEEYEVQFADDDNLIN